MVLPVGATGTLLIGCLPRSGLQALWEASIRFLRALPLDALLYDAFPVRVFFVFLPFVSLNPCVSSRSGLRALLLKVARRNLCNELDPLPSRSSVVGRIAL